MFTSYIILIFCLNDHYHIKSKGNGKDWLTFSLIPEFGVPTLPTTQDTPHEREFLFYHLYNLIKYVLSEIKIFYIKTCNSWEDYYLHILISLVDY